MKKIILLPFIVLFSICCVSLSKYNSLQDLLIEKNNSLFDRDKDNSDKNSEFKNLTFEKVIFTDSVGKDVIYVSIYDWFTSAFNSAKDVIQYSDKESGRIFAKSNTTYSYPKLSLSCYSGWIHFSIKIYIKDNRYKVVLTDFTHENKIGNDINCKLGLITNDDFYTNKGLYKNFHNTIWKDIKIKMANQSQWLFKSIENHTNEIKVFDPVNDEDYNDNW